jgi:hypothetical protein
LGHIGHFPKSKTGASISFSCIVFSVQGKRGGLGFSTTINRQTGVIIAVAL